MTKNDSEEKGRQEGDLKRKKKKYSRDRREIKIQIADNSGSDEELYIVYHYVCDCTKSPQASRCLPLFYE